MLKRKPVRIWFWRFVSYELYMKFVHADKIITVVGPSLKLCFFNSWPVLYDTYNDLRAEHVKFFFKNYYPILSNTFYFIFFFRFFWIIYSKIFYHDILESKLRKYNVTFISFKLSRNYILWFRIWHIMYL